MLFNNSIKAIKPSKLKIELLLPKLVERATWKTCLIFLLKLVVQSCSLRKKKQRERERERECECSGFRLIIKPVALAEKGFTKILRRKVNSPHCELFPTCGDQLKELVWKARQSSSAEQLSETVTKSKGMRICQHRDQQRLSDSCSCEKQVDVTLQSLERKRKRETLKYIAYSFRISTKNRRN